MGAAHKREHSVRVQVVRNQTDFRSFESSGTVWGKTALLKRQNECGQGFQLLIQLPPVPPHTHPVRSGDARLSGRLFCRCLAGRSVYGRHERQMGAMQGKRGSNGAHFGAAEPVIHGGVQNSVVSNGVRTRASSPRGNDRSCPQNHVFRRFFLRSRPLACKATKCRIAQDLGQPETPGRKKRGLTLCRVD